MLTLKDIPQIVIIIVGLYIMIVKPKWAYEEEKEQKDGTIK